MRINEHSLESLRKVVRDLQQENQALKEILEENNIPYESRNVLEERPLPDEYDEDQGARILPYYPNQVPDTIMSMKLQRKFLWRRRQWSDPFTVPSPASAEQNPGAIRPAAAWCR